MKKTRHLNALQSFLFGAVGCLVGSLALFGLAYANTPVVDDFDGYTIGSLDGQGGWGNMGAGNGVPFVTDTVAKSAPYSIHGAGGALPRVIKNVASGTNWVQYFSVYFSDGFTSASQSDWVRFWGDGWAGQHLFYFIPHGGGVSAKFEDGSQWVGDIMPFNTWAVVGIRGDLSGHIYFSTNGGDWIDTGVNNAISSVGMVEISMPDTNWYLDDLSDTSAPPVPPVIAGYAPILTPTAPERNVESVVDFSDVLLSGTLQIPTGNTHQYNKLVVTFQKPDAWFPAQTFSFDLGILTAGLSVNYSATTTVPITTSGANFFKVSYSLTGLKFYGSVADNPAISEPLLTFDNTWVKDSIYAAPASLITPSIKPTQDALEDCGAYSGIDAVVCNIKNFLIGAFLPSDGALNQIGSTMGALKTKFPMNYTSAISDTFATISAGVNDSAPFSFTIFGHTGTVDTSLFTKDLGLGVTLGGAIKLILTFLVFMIFFKWGLNYMHRVLK